MKLMEKYFKAFRLFRKHTKDDDDSVKLRTAISHSNHENDVFTTIKYECKIDVDWVENIEVGLEFVRKAINEEHQFIRSEGEVVPIEKVKRVSKSSVEHLSRHSNFITRLPQDNSTDIIPEKLYIVEKLSDYLVYENRFLYLLLSYVKDFIELRLNSIRAKTSTYQSRMKMEKNIEERSRQIQYKLEYSDIIKNDPYLLEQFSEIPLANRVEIIYAVAVSLLNTPLMKAVAKAPLIKPPVIKTNVLRMNQNFKAALKLYDYITAYSKKGYRIVESKKTFNPFTPEMSDEIAETIQLNSVIGYLSGNNLRSVFEKKMEIEEQALLKEENRKKIEEINRLKKRIVEMNEDPVEYMAQLEKRNAELEKLSMTLSLEKEKNNELLLKISEVRKERQELAQTIDNLNTIIQDKDNEIDQMNHMYYEDLATAEAVHQQELDTMEQTHQKHVENIHNEHLDQVHKLQNIFNTERLELNRQHEHELKYVTDKYDIRANKTDKQILELQETIAALEAEIEHYKSTINLLETDIEELDEANKFANAQYLALRSQQGLLTEDDDFTSKERFKQLEAEMRAYKKLFRQQWKKAKRRIREQIKSETLGTSNKPTKKQK